MDRERDNVQFTNADDDVAIRYWGGSKNGSAPCNFAERPEEAASSPAGAGRPAGADRLAQRLRHRRRARRTRRRRSFDGSRSTPDTLRRPGLPLHRRAPSPAATCRVGFTAEVDTGANDVRGEITVQPVGTAVSPVTVHYDTTGGGLESDNGDGNDHRAPEPHRVRARHIPELRPGRPDVPEGQLAPADGTQVGWQRTAPAAATAAARSRARPSRASRTTSSSSSTRPIRSPRCRSSPPSVTPAAGRSFPALGSTGPFSITFQHTAVDKNHVVLIRDSGRSAPARGNRTRSIYCGNSPGQGAQALENAIKDGCAKDLALNARQDSCAPAPLPSANPWDCVQLEQGQKTSVSKGLEDRFQCTPNNWPTPPGG